MRATYNRAEIIAALKDLLSRQRQLKCDVNAITEETRLDQLGLDSLSILDFLYEIENRFQVQTDAADLASLHRVRDVIDYLESQLAR